MNPRDILNKIKWDDEYNFDFIEIFYVHRGGPADTKIIRGKEVLAIGKTFIKTISAMIPMHRIFKIKYKDEIVFKRNKE
jgi:uncharacterized protein (UPF0248 family)